MVSSFTRSSFRDDRYTEAPGTPRRCSRAASSAGSAIARSVAAVCGVQRPKPESPQQAGPRGTGREATQQRGITTAEDMPAAALRPATRR